MFIRNVKEKGREKERKTKGKRGKGSRLAFCSSLPLRNKKADDRKDFFTPPKGWQDRWKSGVAVGTRGKPRPLPRPPVSLALFLMQTPEGIWAIDHKSDRIQDPIEAFAGYLPQL